MITNADLTLYHIWLSPETQKKEYRRTIIRNIHWYTNQKTTVGDGGLRSADEYKIRIPLESCNDYLPPEAYRKNPDGHWTVDNGDLFVRGELELDIEKASELSGYHPGQVLSWSDNRRGSLPHIRIGGGA
nr:MAG TPA: hypothetical protein [Caudoviricetes sp.]